MKHLAQVFVYGTLHPGESRWPVLAPYVVGEGRAAFVPGELYATGYGYPAASFSVGGGLIAGRVFELRDLDVALELLDELEGAVRGLYRRVVVATTDGQDAWAYECGDPALLVRRIPGGDWRARDQNGE